MSGYVLSTKGLEKVQKKQQQLNKTQEQVAWDACLNRATVSKAVQGFKPIRIQTIRQIFEGLSLTLEPSDYSSIDLVQSTKLVKLMSNDRQKLIEAAESLESEANAAESQGDTNKAEKLRKEATNLRRIATQ